MAGKKKTSVDESPDAAPVGESLEVSLEELTRIVGQLEAGQQSLDDSLRQYERGMMLLRDCHRRLDAAAQRIEVLSRILPGGEVVTEPFDSTSTMSRTKSSAIRTPDSASTGGDLFSLSEDS